MRETLKDHPEALKIWETGFNQRIADQTVVDRFDRRLGTHMRHLERGANEFLESKGLARVKLEAANPEDLNGAIAVYGGSTHVVRLSLPRLVSELYEDQVVGHIGHELTHHEQLNLVSRLWMDIAGVGKTLSPAQRAQVREIGERAVKRAPTDEFFDQVAAHRAGNPLSESESKRALVLEDSWRTLKSGANPKLELTRDRIKEAQTQLLTRGAFQQIQMFNVFDKVGLLKAHSKKMFGVEEPPEEVRQLMAMAKGVKGNTPPPDWNEPQASRIIEGILSERLQGVDAKLQHELKVYREQPHEVEAYAAQHVVERQADIAGYGEEYDFLKKYRGADAATDRLLRALFSVKDE